MACDEPRGWELAPLPRTGGAPERAPISLAGSDAGGQGVPLARRLASKAGGASGVTRRTVTAHSTCTRARRTPKQELKMKAALVAALTLVLGSGLSQLPAQAPCATRRAVVDSAREDVFTVLGSEGKLVAELRREQGIPVDSIRPVTVTDPAICTKLAPAFNRLIPTTATYAVLRIGNIYYARDPDQKRATGVITDSTYRVLMRLGAEVPPPPRRKP